MTEDGREALRAWEEGEGIVSPAVRQMPKKTETPDDPCSRLRDALTVSQERVRTLEEMRDVAGREGWPAAWAKQVGELQERVRTLEEEPAKLGVAYVEIPKPEPALVSVKRAMEEYRTSEVQQGNEVGAKTVTVLELIGYLVSREATPQQGGL